MKNILLTLSLLTCATLHAQQSAIRGEVSIINSQYETKVRQYVANAQVEEDFGRSQSTTTDAAGLFRLVMVGVKEKESITFTIKKEGLEVVNMDALSAVAGQNEMVKVYMATPQKIAEYKRQYYQIGKTSAEKALEEKLKKLQNERQTLLADNNADKTRIRDLETQLGLLEAQRTRIDEDARELARRYAPINLDDTSPLYQEAFSWFQKGDLAQALEVLRQADLAGQARNILAERAKIDASQRELLQRDSLQIQRTAEVLKALQLKADLHQSRFEWDSTTLCFEWMLELDSLNLTNLWDFAYFLQAQNEHQRAITLYENALKLTKTYSERATLLNNLGTLYSANQKMHEAEKAYNEAQSIRKQLADKNPDAFLPDVAMTFNNLGAYYHANQKMPQAEKAYNEALSIYWQLAEKNHDAFLPDVAKTLNNLGNYYRANQKMPQAEKAYTEALSIYRQLTEKNPDAFLHYAAATLNNLGNYYRANQKMPQAEKAYTEALSIYRQLTEKNPDAFLHYVAATLNNLGVFYRDNQKMPQAEKAYTEALSIYRKLAEKNHDAFLPYVAGTLNNLGNYYSDNQNMQQAEKAYTEALSIRRELAEKKTDAFLPDLAATLNNLGVFYSDNQNMPEAEKAYTEALSIRRQLAKKNPDAFLPDVAMTLNNIGNYYSDNQNMPQAEKAYTEALSIYRQMAEKNPDAFLPNVAMTLNNLGVFYETLKKYPDALKHYEEALLLRQTAILSGQGHFFKDWAKVMLNIVEVKDSTEAKKDFVNLSWSCRLLAENYERLQHIDPQTIDFAVQEYGSLSWYALFARDYPLAERAALRCLELDSKQTWVNTNLGHAYLLRGELQKAKAAYSQLKGKKDGEGKDYKLVLEEGFQALETEGITHKGMAEIRRWLKETW